MSGDIVDQIDGALQDWSVSGDAMRWHPEAEQHWGDLLPRQPHAPVRMSVTIDTSAFTRAIEGMVKAFAKLAPSIAKAVAIMEKLRQQADQYDEHHPRPLCIDGHEYHRRRKSRKR